MYRLPYRNFGSHEAIVATHTVNKGGGIAGARWYEIRGLSGSPTVFQQATISQGTKYTWMPSIAMDKMGNIAIGTSLSSSTKDPSLRLRGRVPTDPLGTMSKPKSIVNGTGVQTSTANRWGDYAAMAVDPVDDCTMWFTSEYIKTTGNFNWDTRIASFKFNSCQ
jgi:hypothetical protein